MTGGETLVALVSCGVLVVVLEVLVLRSSIFGDEGVKELLEVACSFDRRFDAATRIGACLFGTDWGYFDAIFCFDCVGESDSGLVGFFSISMLELNDVSTE